MVALPHDLPPRVSPRLPAPTLREVQVFGATVAPTELRGERARQLHALLNDVDADPALTARLAWLTRLVHWLRTGQARGPTTAWRRHVPLGRTARARLRLFLRALDQWPQRGVAVGELLRSVVLDTSAVRLFAQTGLPAAHELWSEAAGRVLQRLLPAPPQPTDLSAFLGRVCTRAVDARWLADLDPEPILTLAAWIPRGAGLTTDARLTLRTAALEAMALVSARVVGLGLADDIVVRGTGGPVADSPFLSLRDATHVVGHLLRRREADQGRVRAALDSLQEAITACRSETDVVASHLEQFGLSVGLVFRLESIGRLLDRLERLAALFAPGPAFALGVTRLFAELARGDVEDHSLRALFGRNLHQMARKIVESCSETGEHYITRTFAEYRWMLLSAAGGGALTAVTCVVKYRVGGLVQAPFLAGLVASANYAGSFMLMQLCGCTLATKQPSMTAATLAHAIHDHDSDDARDLVDQIAQTSRSQFAAALGNVGMVVPTVLAVDIAWERWHGGHLLGAHTAHHVVESLHPLHSGTLLYATLTGVLLWLASVCAGWLRNLSVYRRLPEAIAASPRARGLLGRRGAAWLGRQVNRHVSGVGGNVSLGVLLGMTPIFGGFFGLPLDVRHVTLSTGALTFALCTLGPGALHQPEVLAAVVGVALTGVLNFGVSFWLALSVAMRARRTDPTERVRLGRAVLKSLVRAPLRFLWPPRR